MAYPGLVRSHVASCTRMLEGATLAELIGATGWQAHSVRGFISGTVRKRVGLVVGRDARTDSVLSYRVGQSRG